MFQTEHLPRINSVVRLNEVVRYTIVPTERAHLDELTHSMREKDRAEIADIGISVKKALWRGYRNSVLCRTAIVDGHVGAIWGLCVNLRTGVSLLSDIGVPWLHTSVYVERAPVEFVREARKEIAAMLTVRPQLESYVAADYAQAIRFIRLLGFAVDAPKPVGAHSAMFCRFHKGFH